MANIGRYENIELIGSGGMGQVYGGYDRKMDRKVALKTAFLDCAEASFRELLIKRFWKEIKITAQLDHKHIATPYDVVEHQNGIYLVMEFIAGQSLKTYLDHNEAFGREQLQGITLQLCQAVAHVHGRGIIHRDLKPANIMIDARGEVKLLDFGVARVLIHEPETLTQIGREIGTRGYRTPEQLSGQGVDHRSDIFTLGIVLHELYTGKRPHLRPPAEQIVPSTELMEGHSIKAFDHVFGRALSIEPNDRYSDALELGEDLLDAVKRLGLPNIHYRFISTEKDRALSIGEHPKPPDIPKHPFRDEEHQRAPMIHPEKSGDHLLLKLILGLSLVVALGFSPLWKETARDLEGTVFLDTHPLEEPMKIHLFQGETRQHTLEIPKTAIGGFSFKKVRNLQDEVKIGIALQGYQMVSLPVSLNKGAHVDLYLDSKKHLIPDPGSSPIDIKGIVFLNGKSVNTGEIHLLGSDLPMARRDLRNNGQFNFHKVPGIGERIRFKIVLPHGDERVDFPYDPNPDLTINLLTAVAPVPPLLAIIPTRAGAWEGRTETDHINHLMGIYLSWGEGVSLVSDVTIAAHLDSDFYLGEKPCLNTPAHARTQNALATDYVLYSSVSHLKGKESSWQLCTVDQDGEWRSWARPIGEEGLSQAFRLVFALGDEIRQQLNLPPLAGRDRLALDQLMHERLLVKLIGEGKQALTHFEPQKARYLFERAIQLDKVNPRAYLGLSEAFTRLGSMNEARAAAKEAVHLLKKSGSWPDEQALADGRKLETEGHWKQAIRKYNGRDEQIFFLPLVRALIDANRIDEALETIDQLQSSEKSLSPMTYVKLELEKAAVLEHRYEYRTVLGIAKKLLKHVGGLRDLNKNSRVQLVASVNKLICRAQVMLNQCDSACEQLWHQCVTDFAALGDTHNMAQMYNLWGFSLHRKRDYENSGTWYQLATDLLTENDNKRGQATLLSNHAFTLLERGQEDAATVQYERALELARISNSPETEGIVLFDYAGLIAETGDWSDAEKRYLEASKRFEPINPYYLAMAHTEIGYMRHANALYLKSQGNNTRCLSLLGQTEDYYTQGMVYLFEVDPCSESQAFNLARLARLSYDQNDHNKAAHILHLAYQSWPRAEMEVHFQDLADFLPIRDAGWYRNLSLASHACHDDCRNNDVILGSDQ